MEGREQPLSVWSSAFIRVGIVNDHVLACKKLRAILQLNTTIAIALKFSYEKQPWMERVAKSYHVYQYARQGQHLEEGFKRQWRQQQQKQYRYPDSQEVQGELLLQRLLLQQLRHLLQRIGSSLLQEHTAEYQDRLTYLFLKDGYRRVKVLIADILLIKGADDYVRVCLREGSSSRNKQGLYKATLKELEEILKGTVLVRVNTSCIVNLRHIDFIEKKRTIWIGGEDIPLSENYVVLFYARLRLFCHIGSQFFA